MPCLIAFLTFSESLSCVEGDEDDDDDDDEEEEEEEVEDEEEDAEGDEDDTLLPAPNYGFPLLKRPSLNCLVLTQNCQEVLCTTHLKI